ncbi:MAG: outer membrane protein transport protein [Hyphomicrobiaceae bacterium]
MSGKRTTLLGTVAVVALVASAASAMAGGFAIREQSTESQGASFAGNAAGTSLGAMFWNPAAAANKPGPGINTESNYALIIPRAEVTVDSVTPSNGFFAAAPNSSEIGHNAIVPASYASYQISSALFLGLGINSGFGLGTEPENSAYDGAVLGRRSQLFTAGATPTLAYVVAPGVTLGAGVQINYAKGTFKFATALPQQPSSVFSGDDVAFGVTAGVMLTPAPGTRIGLGWRSALTHELEGDFNQPTITVPGVGTFPGTSYKGTADVKLPDIVTLSLNQALSPNMRLLGTVEWSNWSRFQELRVQGGGVADIVIPANWSDGWFFSIGAEYDYSQKLTLRTGVGYEISPIDDPKKRLIGIPDSDRIWLSVGGNYKITQATSVDVAYTHVFLDDSRFDRDTTTGRNLKGSIEASTDILSVGLKTKF